MDHVGVGRDVRKHEIAVRVGHCVGEFRPPGFTRQRDDRARQRAASRVSDRTRDSGRGDLGAGWDGDRAGDHRGGHKRPSSPNLHWTASS